MLLLNYAAYFIVKLTGYTYFAGKLNKIFGVKQNKLKVGLIRTLLGVVLGTTFHYCVLYVFKLDVSQGRNPFGGEDVFLYLVSLIVLRIIEWNFLVYIFYSKQFTYNSLKATIGGLIISFLLDIPVMFGLFIFVASIC